MPEFERKFQNEDVGQSSGGELALNKNRKGNVKWSAARFRWSNPSRTVAAFVAILRYDEGTRSYLPVD
jgi:hypothetical protein